MCKFPEYMHCLKIIYSYDEWPLVRVKGVAISICIFGSTYSSEKNLRWRLCVEGGVTVCGHCDCCMVDVTHIYPQLEKGLVRGIALFLPQHFETRI